MVKEAGFLIEDLMVGAPFEYGFDNDAATFVPNLSFGNDIPLALPALLRAEKLQKRLASVGFDWDSPERVLEKVAEEAGEIVAARAEGASPAKLEDEIGDLLFVIANLARHLKVDPEAALRSTNAKVMRRFAWIEAELAAKGRKPSDATLEEMEALWVDAKAKT